MRHDLIFLLGLLVLLSGCAITPTTSIRLITKSDDTLYVFTKDGIVKKIKASSFELVGRMKFPDLSYSSSNYSPYVESVVSNKNDFLVQAYQPSHFGKNEINVYSITNNKLIKQNTLINSRIISSDGTYLYGVETLSDNINGNIVKNRKSIKYDKGFKRINHDSAIINGGNYFVKDVFDDKELTWYICLRADSKFMPLPMIREPNLSGSFVLVVKDKSTDVYTEHEIPGTFAYVSDEIDDIWFFGDEYRRTNLAVFSKHNRTLNTKEIDIDIIPFPHQKFLKSSDYLWGYSFQNRKIYRIKKLDLTYISIEAPTDILIDSFFVPMYSDDDNVWIGATKHRNSPPFMNEVPYIVNLQKNNLTVKSMPITPTIGEATATILKSIHSWLIYPVLMIFSIKM